MLDVACGSGRHLRLALESGFRATGVDRDLARVADLAGITGVELIEADLEAGAPLPFTGQRFGVVIVTNYLWRPILDEIVSAVAEDGLLIYETYAVGHARHGKPTNPDYLLRPGELLSVVRDRLIPLAYEHVELGEPKRVVQRICAAGSAHRWIEDGAPAQ